MHLPGVCIFVQKDKALLRKDDDGKTALMHAASPLQKAASSNSMAIVTRLLDAAGNLIDEMLLATDNAGTTPP